MALTLHSLYGGEVEISFDEEPHVYKRLKPGPETVLAGVTSKTNILNKPALIPWYLRQAMGAVNKIIQPGVFVTEDVMKQIESAIMDTGFKNKEKAGDVGTDVHAWVCKYIKSLIGFNECPALPVDFQVRNGVIAWVDWQPTGIEWLESERLVYSRVWDACGTLDQVGRLDGIKTLWDLKTGSGIYEEYWYQVGAYYGYYNEEMKAIGGEPVTRGQIIRVDKAKAVAIPSPFIDQEMLEELYEHYTLLHRLYSYRPVLSKKLKGMMKEAA